VSWVEDNGYDAYDEPEYPAGSDNMAVWVDKDWNQTPIHQLETRHIENIIRNLEDGKSYFGQADKLDTLKRELNNRKENIK